MNVFSFGEIRGGGIGFMKKKLELKKKQMIIVGVILS